RTCPPLLPAQLPTEGDWSGARRCGYEPVLRALRPDGEAAARRRLRPVEITVVGSLRSCVDSMMVVCAPAPFPRASASPLRSSVKLACLVRRTPSAAEAAAAARSFSQVGMSLAHFMQVQPAVQRGECPLRRRRAGRGRPPSYEPVRAGRECLAAGP